MGEQLGDALLFLGSGRDAEIRQRLADDGAGGKARVQRRVRILEHDLHIAPVLPHGGGRELGHVDAVENDAARGRLEQLEHHPADRGLAASGFPDEPQGLGAADREADAIDGLHGALAPQQQAAMHREVLDQVADLQADRLAHATAPTRSASQQAT
jgi:hypothetical protein